MSEPAIDTAATTPRASKIPAKGQPLPPPERPGGKAIVLADGREWIVPPLLLGQIYGPVLHVFGELLRQMVAVAEDKVPQLIFAQSIVRDTLEVARMALDSNYPSLELTLDDMGRLLDFSNAQLVLSAVYDLNGFCLETLRLLGITPPQKAKPTVASGKTE